MINDIEHNEELAEEVRRKEDIREKHAHQGPRI